MSGLQVGDFSINPKEPPHFFKKKPQPKCFIKVQEQRTHVCARTHVATAQTKNAAQDFTKSQSALKSGFKPGILLKHNDRLKGGSDRRRTGNGRRFWGRSKREGTEAGWGEGGSSGGKKRQGSSSGCNSKEGRRRLQWHKTLNRNCPGQAFFSTPPHPSTSCELSSTASPPHKKKHTHISWLVGGAGTMSSCPGRTRWEDSEEFPLSMNCDGPPSYVRI